MQLNSDLKIARNEVHIQGDQIEGENVYSVQDNGIGFDMEFENRIFEVFIRLDTSGKYEGTGGRSCYCKTYHHQAWGMDPGGIGSGPGIQIRLFSWCLERGGWI